MHTADRDQIRSFGVSVGVGYVLLSVAYAGVLAVGLGSLAFRDDPIGDPYFPVLEILILLMCPMLVALFAVIHLRAPNSRRGFSLTALVFAALTAGLTASVHFAILTLSRAPAFANMAGHDLVFSFHWPSLVYALDILAWDGFFAVAALCAARAVHPGPLSSCVSALFLGSGVLALAGLTGVVLNDMQVRNIGVFGYVGVFTVAVFVYVLHLRRSRVADWEQA